MMKGLGARARFMAHPYTYIHTYIHTALIKTVLILELL
jgi:hypothetical protein